MAQKITVTTGKPIKGKDIFYFIQSVHAKIGDNAILPAYRTDGNTTLGGDFSDEQTQQGRLLEKTTNEHSIELTQYFAPADPSVKIIEDAQRKIWSKLDNHDHVIDTLVVDMATAKDNKESIREMKK